MKELLTWLYGKSSKNAHIRGMAEKAILLLREKGSLEYQELCALLEVGFDKYKKPKRTFYFVVNPLKRVALIQEKRVFGEDGKRYRTMYFLSPDAFYGYMKKTVDDFHSQIKQ